MLATQAGNARIIPLESSHRTFVRKHRESGMTKTAHMGRKAVLVTNSPYIGGYLPVYLYVPFTQPAGVLYTKLLASKGE